jgi:hypothetical protein
MNDGGGKEAIQRVFNREGRFTVNLSTDQTLPGLFS